MRVVGPSAHLSHPDLPPLDALNPPSAHQARVTRVALENLVTSPSSRWFPVLSILRGDHPRPPGVRSLLRADADAVVTTLRHHGFPDAEVEIEIGPEKVWWISGKASPNWRSARFVVTPGPRDVVADSDLRVDEPLPAALTAAVLQALPVAGTATSPTLQAALALRVRELVRDAGFPHTEVTVTSTADEHRHTLQIDVRRGPALPTGPFDLRIASDLDRTVPAGLAARFARAMPPHTPWDGERAKVLVDALDRWPSMQRATLLPGSADDSAAPTVELVPTPKRVFRVSPNITALGALLGLGAHIEWGRHGLAGGLVSLEGGGDLTWRVFEGPPGRLVSGAQTGPGFNHRVVLTAPLVPLHAIGLHAEADGGIESVRGATSLHAHAGVGLVWRPTQAVRVELLGRGGYVRHVAFPLQQAPFAASFRGPGATLADRYDDLALHLRLRADNVRGHPLPTSGTSFLLDLAPIGSSNGQRWHRFHVDLRTHLPLLPGRITLVPHLAAGLHSFDDTAPASGLLTHRFFLGGTDTVRGFGTRRLGPPGAHAGLDGVMVGGDAMLLASLELQGRIHRDVIAAAFTDVGRVWESGLDRVDEEGNVVQQGVNLRDLQPTAGVGLVIRTPIGGFAAWAGVRLLKDTGLATRLPRLTLHVSLTEDF